MVAAFPLKGVVMCALVGLGQPFALIKKYGKGESTQIVGTLRGIRAYVAVE